MLLTGCKQNVGKIVLVICLSFDWGPQSCPDHISPDKSFFGFCGDMGTVEMLRMKRVYQI